MTHFSRSKWLDFKKDTLSKEENIVMEDHLYTCDACMDIYLDLIDTEDLNLAGMMISSDFTKNIMGKIENVRPIRKVRKKKKMIENIFMYYIAAASVILVLTAGGVFTKITQLPIEKIEVDKFKAQKDIGSLYSFTEKITSSTNSFINNFGTRKQGGK
ncbi:MAG: hypothetical protein ACTHW2_10005 [Tissierella sp.]|uniref:hypothetical protein n=1 Tax=Tissierella sp. TaxID=41274 RepID=UPI003F9B374F